MSMKWILKTAISRHESSALVTNAAENNDRWSEIAEKVRKREKEIFAVISTYVVT